MTVSNAAQAGVDRTDIADTMGHTAMELTCVCSIESGPCERVESLQMSGRF